MPSSGVGRLVRVLPMVVCLGVVGGLAAFGFAPGASPTVPERVTAAATEARPSTVTGGWPAPRAVAATPTAPTSFDVADAVGPTVSLFSAPDVPLTEKPELRNPTGEGLPVVFLVLAEQGPWLQVRVSSRPNGLTAWVRRSEVTMRTVANHVKVELAAKRVTVYHGDEILLQAAAGVGTDATPTPIGTFFVDGIINLTDSPNGPYGSHQVSVSGFSEVHQTFGGGVGQIALHGTNRPQLLGQPVTNGCVRLRNDDIAKLQALAPPGTPVDVVP